MRLNEYLWSKGLKIARYGTFNGTCKMLIQWSNLVTMYQDDVMVIPDLEEIGFRRNSSKNPITWFCLDFTSYQQYFSYSTTTVHKSMFPGLYLTST